MKIYVMTDMEGVAGVVNADDYLAPGARYYEVARELATGEVNAAIEGALEAGAEARDLVPTIETVIVKWGVARGSASGLDERQNELFNGAAIHLHPTRARALIRMAARRAVERRQGIGPFRLPGPYQLISVRRKRDAEPPKTARVEAADLIELLRLPRQHA